MGLRFGFLRLSTSNSNLPVDILGSSCVCKSLFFLKLRMLCMQVSCNLPSHLSQARRVPPFIFEGPLCSHKEYFLMLCISFCALY